MRHVLAQSQSHLLTRQDIDRFFTSSTIATASAEDVLDKDSMRSCIRYVLAV